MGLTFCTRGLQIISSQRTPAYGKDVPGIISAPVIEGTSPAIKCYQDLRTSHLPNGGRADEVRVLPVHCFQLHTCLEEVLGRRWWFLQEEVEYMLKGDVAVPPHTRAVPSPANSPPQAAEGSQWAGFEPQ